MLTTEKCFALKTLVQNDHLRVWDLLRRYWSFGEAHVLGYEDIWSKQLCKYSKGTDKLLSLEKSYLKAVSSRKESFYLIIRA